MRNVRRAISGVAISIATLVSTKADPLLITELLKRVTKSSRATRCSCFSTLSGFVPFRVRIADPSICRHRSIYSVAPMLPAAIYSRMMALRGFLPFRVRIPELSLCRNCANCSGAPMLPAEIYSRVMSLRAMSLRVMILQVFCLLVPCLRASSLQVLC